MSTRWHPISSEGVSRASRRASSKASPFAISVVAVRMPSWCASTIPRFTSRVKPKSSALTTSNLRLLKTTFSEYRQPDGEKFLRIGVHFLDQRLDLLRSAAHRIVQLRIHQKLPKRALAGVDLVHGAVQLRHQLIQTPVQHIVLQ